MNCKNTHIRTLAAILAFASVTLARSSASAPASASAQNAASQQPAVTAADSFQKSDKKAQFEVWGGYCVMQPNTQPIMTLDQKRVQAEIWGRVCVLEENKLKAYLTACSNWQMMYGGVALPAISKYGTPKDKATAKGVGDGIAKVKKESLASWDKIQKASNLQGEAGVRLYQNRTEKNYEAQKKTMDDYANVFNAGSEKIFKGGQTFVQYHQQVTEIVDGIVGELKKNPQTEDAAMKLDRDWKRNPAILKTSQQITVKPFELDPTVTMTFVSKAPSQPKAGKGGAKKAGKQK